MGEKYEELLARYQTDVLTHIVEAKRLYERVKELENKHAALLDEYRHEIQAALDAKAQAQKDAAEDRAIARQSALNEIDRQIAIALERHVLAAHSADTLSNAACDAVARRLATIQPNARPRRRTPPRPG